MEDVAARGCRVKLVAGGLLETAAGPAIAEHAQPLAAAVDAVVVGLDRGAVDRNRLRQVHNQIGLRRAGVFGEVAGVYSPAPASQRNTIKTPRCCDDVRTKISSMPSRSMSKAITAPERLPARSGTSASPTRRTPAVPHPRRDGQLHAVLALRGLDRGGPLRCSRDDLLGGNGGDGRSQSGRGNKQGGKAGHA